MTSLTANAQSLRRSILIIIKNINYQLKLSNEFKKLTITCFVQILLQKNLEMQYTSILQTLVLSVKHFKVVLLHYLMHPIGSSQKHVCYSSVTLKDIQNGVILYLIQYIDLQVKKNHIPGEIVLINVLKVPKSMLLVRQHAVHLQDTEGFAHFIMLHTCMILTLVIYIFQGHLFLITLPLS